MHIAKFSSSNFVLQSDVVLFSSLLPYGNVTPPLLTDHALVPILVTRVNYLRKKKKKIQGKRKIARLGPGLLRIFATLSSDSDVTAVLH